MIKFDYLFLLLSSPSIYRRIMDRPPTQINMLQLARAKLQPQKSATNPLHSLPPLINTSIKSGRRRERSPEGDSVSVSSDEKGWSGIGTSAAGGLLSLRTVWEHPWRRYTKEYDLDLAGPVIVSVRKGPPIELVHVRAFPTSAAETTLYMFRRVHHDNIVTPLESFTTDDFLYIILEYMPVSLHWIVRCPAYPNERQLRAILRQVSFRHLIDMRAFTDVDRYWKAWLTLPRRGSNTDLLVA
jgi:hypothetical protein